MGCSVVVREVGEGVSSWGVHRGERAGGKLTRISLVLQGVDACCKSTDGLEGSLQSRWCFGSLDCGS